MAARAGPLVHPAMELLAQPFRRKMPKIGEPDRSKSQHVTVVRIEITRCLAQPPQQGELENQHNEIRSQAKISTDRTIQRLLDLDLLERRVSATENPEKSRRASYAIGDRYDRFSFRFITPQRGAIDRGLGAEVVENIITGLDEYVGLGFNELARSYARHFIADGTLPGDAVSTWWSNDGQHEIDIVGTAARRPTFIGSVKWRREPLGAAVLHHLERAAAVLEVPNIPRLLVGRAGVRPDVAARTGVRGVSADDLYR